MPRTASSRKGTPDGGRGSIGSVADRAPAGVCVVGFPGLKVTIIAIHWLDVVPEAENWPVV